MERATSEINVVGRGRLVARIEGNSLAIITNTIHEESIAFLFKFVSYCTRTSTSKVLDLLINRKFRTRKPYIKSLTVKLG